MDVIDIQHLLLVRHEYTTRISTASGVPYDIVAYWASASCGDTTSILLEWIDQLELGCLDDAR